MKHELTCIGCPMGCQIHAKRFGETIADISGNACKVGERYAREELTAPRRTVTALVRVRGTHRPLPVKTDRPIEKRFLFDCLNEIRKHTCTAPVSVGDVVLASVCGTDVNIIATAEIGMIAPAKND